MDINRHHHWRETLVIALIWLVLGWIVWDFFHWVDPAYRIDPTWHPPRISPRDLNPDDRH